MRTNQPLRAAREARATLAGYDRGMKTVRLRVHDGKLVGDAPASLREGTVLHAVIADREEEMSPDELDELNRTLDESWDELEQGREISAADVIRTIRAVR